MFPRSVSSNLFQKKWLCLRRFPPFPSFSPIYPRLSGETPRGQDFFVFCHQASHFNSPSLWPSPVGLSHCYSPRFVLFASFSRTICPLSVSPPSAPIFGPALYLIVCSPHFAAQFLGLFHTRPILQQRTRLNPLYLSPGLLPFLLCQGVSCRQRTLLLFFFRIDRPLRAVFL